MDPSKEVEVPAQQQVQDAYAHAMAEALDEYIEKKGGGKKEQKSAPKAPRGRPRKADPAITEDLGPRQPPVSRVDIQPRAPKVSAAAKKVIVEGQDAVAKARVIRHIKKYQALLKGEKYQGSDGAELGQPKAGMRLEDLEALKEGYRSYLHMNDARHGVEALYLSSVSAIEAAAQIMDPFQRLNGLADAVSKEEERISPILDELAIEYDDYFHMDPRRALLMQTSFIAGQVFLANQDRLEGKGDNS